MKASVPILALAAMLGLNATAHAGQLRGEWDFEDPADLGHDSSGEARHAIVEGDPQAVPGRVLPGATTASALAFDGDDYLRIPTGGFSLSGLDELTVEAWVKVDLHTGRNVFRAQQPVELRSDGLSIRGDDGVWHSLLASTPPPLGAWYHLAGTFRRGELRVYVDGRLANVATVAVEQVVAGAVYPEWALGARIPGGAGPDQHFVGALDLVRVHDRALTAADILARAHDRGDLDVVDVKSFGAAGDGVTDDTDAIQDALDDAALRGAEVHLPSGIYRLSGLLQIPGSVLVRGDGDTVLKPLAGTGDDVNPVFLLNGVDRVTIRDLQIDGFASGLVQASGHAAIWISGSSLVHVDQVSISDLGKTAGDAGGIHILIEAREIGSAPYLVQGIPLVQGVASERNVIENCRLDDNRHIANFGIRLWSDWTSLPPTGSFTAPVRENLIENNHLSGFYWNAIEIAGPATGFNRIDGNTVADAFLVAIEADKGASDNRFENNWILRVSIDGHLGATAMRDQGVASPDGSFEFWAERNVFFRNTVANVRSTSWAAGIFLDRSRDVTVSESTFRDIDGPPANRTAGILERVGRVDNPTYTDNGFSAVPREVGTIP